jgi:two-component system, LytTR family, sensor kinase
MKTVHWLIVAALWNLVAIISIIRDSIYGYIKTATFSWSGTALLNFSHYWTWAILTPIVYRICSAFPITAGHRARNAVLLLAAGLIVSTMHSFGAYILEFSIRDLAGVLGDQTVWQVVASIDRLTIPGIFNSFITYVIIVALIHGYKFYKNLQDQKVLTAKLETSLAEMKLQTLKAQLHPHFLFNALNTVSALIRKDPRRADNVVTSLSELLRYSLTQTSAQKVDLEAEINFVKKYLEIQQVRFEDKLTTSFHVDESALKIGIPPLLLQPLVENAVKHGIEPSHLGGQISIKIAKNDGRLEIEVKDTGVGLSSGSSYTRTGIGLTNTRERLVNTYGDRFSFDITNNSPSGVCVSIVLPLQMNVIA